MSFGGSPVLPGSPCPTQSPAHSQSPSSCAWSSGSHCPNVLSEPFALPTLRASQLRGVLGKCWLSPWHPGCSARHRLFPINSMSVALPHFFSASSSPGAAQRLCGQSPSVPLGQKSWKSFWGAAGSLRTGFLRLKLGALVSPWLGRGDWFWGWGRAG